VKRDPFVKLTCEQGHPAVAKTEYDDLRDVRTTCPVESLVAGVMVPCRARIVRRQKLVGGRFVDVASQQS